MAGLVPEADVRLVLGKRSASDPKWTVVSSKPQHYRKLVRRRQPATFCTRIRGYLATARIGPRVAAMSLKYTIAAAMVFLAGCTSTGVIDSNQATIEPDSSVIAFSVNTGKLLEYETPIRPVRLHIYYAGEWVSIRLSDGKTGLQRILLEVPAQAVSFTQLDLVAGAGIFSDHYVTGDVQVAELTYGEITYLGRIEIEDIKFEENADGSLGKPIAVKLVFSDALEDDQLAWQQQYKLFQNRVPNQQVVGNWAGRDYLNLGRKQWSKGYAQKNTGRPGYSGGERTHMQGPKDVGRSDR